MTSASKEFKITNVIQDKALSRRQKFEGLKIKYPREKLIYSIGNNLISPKQVATEAKLPKHPILISNLPSIADIARNLKKTKNYMKIYFMKMAILK